MRHSATASRYCAGSRTVLFELRPDAIPKTGSRLFDWDVCRYCASVAAYDCVAVSASLNSLILTVVKVARGVRSLDSAID
jgi:hypothetical protein